MQINNQKIAACVSLGPKLGGLDSDQDIILQRDEYYRYTTSQSILFSLDTLSQTLFLTVFLSLLLSLFLDRLQNKLV